MNNLWWCANCTSIVNLTLHGVCSICGSNAVDVAVHGPQQDAATSASQLRELAKRAIAEHEIRVLESMMK